MKLFDQNPPVGAIVPKISGRYNGGNVDEHTVNQLKDGASFHNFVNDPNVANAAEADVALRHSLSIGRSLLHMRVRRYVEFHLMGLEGVPTQVSCACGNALLCVAALRYCPNSVEGWSKA